MKYGESVVVDMEPDLELAEQAVSAGDITSSLVLIAENNKNVFKSQTYRVRSYYDIAVRDVSCFPENEPYRGFMIFFDPIP